MISHQVTTTLIGLGVAATVLLLVRRDRLHGPYAAWWLITAAAIFVLGLFPRVFDTVAYYLGVGYPPILGMLLGLALILIKVLLLDLERSRQEITIRRLVQRLAILQARFDELENQTARETAADPEQRSAPPAHRQRLNAGSAPR